MPKKAGAGGLIWFLTLIRGFVAFGFFQPLSSGEVAVTSQLPNALRRIFPKNVVLFAVPMGARVRLAGLHFSGFDVGAVGRALMPGQTVFSAFPGIAGDKHIDRLLNQGSSRGL